jgi:hypothetical protein
MLMLSQPAVDDTGVHALAERQGGDGSAWLEARGNHLHLELGGLGAMASAAGKL